MKKRILVIGPGMQVGGVERSLLGLLNAIDPEIADIDLFLFEHQGEFMKYLPEHINLLPEDRLLALSKWPIVKLFLRGHFFTGAMRLAAKTFSTVASKITDIPNVNTHRCNKWLMPFTKKQQKKYDLALGFFGPHFYLIEKVSALKKYGWVHTDYSSPYAGVNKSFEEPMWSKLDRIICVSDACRFAFIGVFPDLADKVAVIENILDPALVRRQAEELSVSDEMPDDGSMRILSIGRFCKAKAFDEAVPACRKLIDEGYNIRWYIIGYGPDESLIRSLIRTYELQERFIILGKKTNPYPYIQACDLYAQPSRYEGKAVAVREAQILGKPVLITDFETSNSQLDNGVDGHICPMGVEGIVKGIKHMLDNPDLMRRIAENASKRDYGNVEEAAKLLNLTE